MKFKGLIVVMVIVFVTIAIVTRVPLLKNLAFPAAAPAA